MLHASTILIEANVIVYLHYTGNSAKVATVHLNHVKTEVYAKKIMEDTTAFVTARILEIIARYILQKVLVIITFAYSLLSVYLVEKITNVNV